MNSYGSKFFLLIRSANKHVTVSTINLLAYEHKGYCLASWRDGGKVVLEHNEEGALLCARAESAVSGVKQWMKKYISSDFFFAADFPESLMSICFEHLRLRKGNMEVHGVDGLFFQKSKIFHP